jgi:transposase
VKVTHLQFLNALLFVAEQGCKWRGLPSRFGPWHTIYTRMNRRSKNGTLDRVFALLQHEQIVRIQITAVKPGSSMVKAHPDGPDALEKTIPKSSAGRVADGPPRFIWLPRMLERP